MKIQVPTRDESAKPWGVTPPWHSMRRAFPCLGIMLRALLVCCPPAAATPNPQTLSSLVSTLPSPNEATA